jgi:short-subunit dehydrogenase
MNIIITGAARGIGKAIAEKFATEKNNIFLCARNKTTLDETTLDLQIRFKQSNIYSMVADISVKENAESFATFCLAHGEPDILINNAGGFVPGNLLDEKEGNLESMIANNLYSAYYITRKLVPAMKTKKSGHIFNISSIAGLKAYEAGGSYSISKFALNGFSQNLRLELMQTGIKVTTVFPGAVFTDSWVGFDNSQNRIMDVADIADIIFACTKLSPSAVPEEITLRPQLGDL